MIWRGVESYPDEGFTRTKVAEPVGMKRSNYGKVKTVYDTAHDEAAPEPVRAVAQQQMVALDAGETTPNAADTALRKAGAGTRQTLWQHCHKVMRRPEPSQTAGRGRPKTDDSPVANWPQGYDDG